MNKFKKWIITYLIPITKNVMLDYIDDHDIAVYLDDKEEYDVTEIAKEITVK